ncbi:MAG TPA: hypothetical protein VGH28_10745 [Polyangiaceae bacterium]
MRAALATFFVSAGAIAQTQTPSAVKIDWEADARCPPESTFVDQVHARSPRVLIDASAARTLVVRIARAGEKTTGRIELREADGASTQRSVAGASCQEVIEALGLVAAVALDPLASTAPTTETPPAGSSHGVSTTETPPASSSRRVPAAETSTATPSGGAPASPWGFVAGVDGEVVAGPTPDVTFATPVFFEATRALSEHVALGGGLRFERTGETTSGGDFTWTAGAAQFCVVLRGGRVRFDACARGDFGTIDARGENVTPARSATRPWADAGLALAFRVRIAGPVFFELEGSGGFALVQDRFFVQPDATVYQVPVWTGHGGAGLGFEIR